MAQSGLRPRLPTARAAVRVVAAGSIACALLLPVAARAVVLFHDDFEPVALSTGCAGAPGTAGWRWVDGSPPARENGCDGSPATGVDAFSGRASLLLSPPGRARGTIERTVAVPSGARLQLRLAMAALPDAEDAPRVRVRVGGEDRTVEGLVGGRWAVRTVAFTVPEGQAAVVVSIAAVSDGVAVDALAVEPATRLASLPVLVGGLLWIGWVINRRRAHPLVPQLTLPR